MSAITVIIVAVAVIVVTALVAMLLRRQSVEREIEHERVSGEAFAHRDQAEANVARARDLGEEAEAERRQAEEHAVAADEHARAAQEHAERATRLEERVQIAGKAAAFHDEQAAEREDKLA